MQPPNISPIFTDKRYEAWNRILLSLKTFFKEVQDLFQNLLKFVRKDNLTLDMDQKARSMTSTTSSTPSKIAAMRS